MFIIIILLSVVIANTNVMTIHPRISLHLCMAGLFYDSKLHEKKSLEDNNKSVGI